MQKSIDEAAQRRRRKEAIQSVVFYMVMTLLAAGVKLGLRWYYHLDNVWGALLLVLSVLELGGIIPAWVLLRTRLKEIEGGEEDAAAQY